MIITRKEAIARGLKYYFTGKPCKRGHIGERKVHGGCPQCRKEHYQENRFTILEKKVQYHKDNAIRIAKKNAQHYRDNKEKITEYKARYNKNNKDRINAKVREYRKNNKEKVRLSKAKYSKKNKIKMKEYQDGYYSENKRNIIKRKKKYAINNREKINYLSSKRRTAKLNRTPSWLSDVDKDIIKNMFARAARVSRETGITHHVDHIIPLQGKNVSGLHVPWNLQILTAKENMAKGNRISQ